MLKLKDIAASEALRDDLDWPFDFSIARAEGAFSWIRLQPKSEFQVIAGDSSGGAFLAYGSGAIEELPILHATSEGEAGKVAENLTEFLALLLAVPYWRDLLKFSGGGHLVEMRNVADLMEREYAEDYPELPAARSRIVNALCIPAIRDPVKVLHDNVESTNCTLVSADGSKWRSLFNTFVTSDNPMWR